MLSNVGHTIQKMINNTPIAITANETTTEVVTNGGNVYQTGFIDGKIQHSFREIFANSNIIGRIVDAAAVEDAVYLLSSSGSVFEYDYNAGECGGAVREVYSAATCGNGDKAVKIKAGRAHILILTEGHRVFGVGDNSEYQLVPQGQCRYDTAVEVIVTDTNLHDNECCTSFVGVVSELECPVIPTCETKCNNISCLKDSRCDVLLGYLNITKVVICPPDNCGIFSIPVYGDISYNAFLCVDKGGCASGQLTYTITRLYVKCGCLLGKFTTNDSCGCHVKDLNLSSTTEILIFEADQCQSPKTDLCARNSGTPIRGVSQINGKCGSCIVVNVDLPSGLPIPGAAFDLDCKTLLLELNSCRTSIAVLCDGAICDLGCKHDVDLDLDFDVPLDCCEPYSPPKPELQLPQPCWSNIYAGFDSSVLVDNCNRIYVFGSIHNVRSNKELLRKSCLEDLLNRTHASISFPADQLNCGNRTANNNNCPCPKCKDKPFKTDLNKFGISLNFPGGNDECDKNMNVCDFLQTLKRCNESVGCEPTCEPCDGYIYLNVSGNCGCPCGAPSAASIGSITIFNRKSICKLVSQGCPDVVCLSAEVSTIVEFDLNKYCIDATDVVLDKIVKLDFCTEGPNVNIYLDIDQPGGIKFTADGKRCNVEFSVSASTKSHQYLLNYGSILDPVALTNLKYALSLDCFYPCPRFKNPFDTKLTNTYLRGGDRVRFVSVNPKNIRQAITPDIPTVFRLNRRVIDVAVGINSLTALVGGLACPNELFAIGQNCHGELGLGTNESIVCWKQLNRCTFFDCQVTQIFAGRHVTFYATQSHHIYAAGQWKCFVNSTSPALVKSICQSWKIKEMAITKNTIILLGADGCIFGLGDNSLGELGLCHTDCVTKPTPLVFFYKLNNGVAKQLREGLSHPVESNYKKLNKGNGNGNGNNYSPNNYGPNNYGPRNQNYNNCGNCGFNPCQCNGNNGNNGNNGWGGQYGPCGPNPCGPCPPCPPCGPNSNSCGPLKYNKYPKGGGFGSNKKYNPNNRVFPKHNKY